MYYFFVALFCVQKGFSFQLLLHGHTYLIARAAVESLVDNLDIRLTPRHNMFVLSFLLSKYSLFFWRLGVVGGGG